MPKAGGTVCYYFNNAPNLREDFEGILQHLGSMLCLLLLLIIANQFLLLFHFALGFCELCVDVKGTMASRHANGHGSLYRSADSRQDSSSSMLQSENCGSGGGGSASPSNRTSSRSATLVFNAHVDAAIVIDFPSTAAGCGKVASSGRKGPQPAAMTWAAVGTAQPSHECGSEMSATPAPMPPSSPRACPAKVSSCSAVQLQHRMSTQTVCSGDFLRRVDPGTAYGVYHHHSSSQHPL